MGELTGGDEGEGAGGPSRKFENNYKPPTFAELTAVELVRHAKDIRKRLQKEGISPEQANKLYELCKGCAVYKDNFTPMIKDDIFGFTGKDTESCGGITIRPLLDNQDKLTFHISGVCKGYIGLKSLQK